jgi:hypothetical protein
VVPRDAVRDGLQAFPSRWTSSSAGRAASTNAPPGSAGGWGEVLRVEAQSNIRSGPAGHLGQVGRAALHGGYYLKSGYDAALR